MNRVTFSLELPAANVEEYERRHREMWPELSEAIRRQGGRNYSIWVLPDVDRVFGYVEVDDLVRWNAGGTSPLTRKWWEFMSDIMPTHPNHSPISFPTLEVFHQD